MNKLFSFTEWLTEQQSQPLYFKQITEGGAYGHVSHPFDDLDLTMSDLIDLIKITVHGGFTVDNFTQEKTDGMNLLISYRDNKLIAARNKSHLKNAGQNALDIAGISDLFKGRGDIEIAYNSAMKDLTTSINALSNTKKLEIFKNGSVFASVEIITPITQNTVPYGKNMLIFHGLLEYDLSGNVINSDKQGGRTLGKLIQDANAAAQETFYIRGPHDLEIKPIRNAKQKENYYLEKLKTIMKSSNIKNNDTLADLILGNAINMVNIIQSTLGIIIPTEAVEGIAKRISGINKSFTVSDIKKSLGSQASVYLEYEKNQEKWLKKEIYFPIESLFLELGTDVMLNMESFLAANPTQAAVEMKSEIQKSISEIKKLNNEDAIRKLEYELKRLSAVGGLDQIVPTEGITFMFKGKLYKYTGIFAITHQIRSILAYK